MRVIDEETATEPESRGPKQGNAVTRAPFLFCAMHCDAPLLGGARYGLTKVDEVVFSRGPEREHAFETSPDGRVLHVRVPGTFVSRTHARLVRAQSTWVLADAGSRNGTFLKGERISRAMLADGDTFEIGRTMFVFRAGVAVTGDVGDHDVRGEISSLATLLPELEARHHHLAAVARSQLPVLLLGDSGAGKEVAARAVHDLSGRAGAFVAMNCAAIPRSLLESQLFGHAKGAFSGAVRDEPGHLRAADGGTLFLDELGDLPLESQAAFLRVLEDGAVVPVGTTRPIPVDVRFVAATNRPLAELVAQRAFREDLLARLSGFTHPLLPLRARIEDLGLLVAALLPRIAGPDAARVVFEPEAARLLFAHRWPLNVRELRHCLSSALVLAAGAPVSAAHVMPALSAALGPTPSATGDGLRERLVTALTEHQGNVAAVARVFGKAPTQIHRWMKQLALDVDAFRPGGPAGRGRV